MKSICCYFRLGMQPTVDCLEAVATWINDRNCQENAKECETLPLVIPNLDMNWGEWLAYYSQPAANSTDVLRSIWLQNRGPQIFHKSMIHLKIPDVRTVAWSRYWVSRKIMRHSTKFTRTEDLAPGICAPLHYNYFFFVKKIYFAANLFPSFFSYNWALQGLTNKHENVWRIGHFFSLGTSCSECWSPNIGHLTSSETAIGTHWIGGWGTTGLV